MNRYIQRNWIRNIKKTGTSSVEDYVNKDHDQRPARFVQMIAGYVGGILALAGIIMILSDILKGSDAGPKIMSFVPIILGGAAYVFYKMKHPTNDILRELTSAFLFITFGLSLALSVVAFNIEMDNPQYLIYIMLAVGLTLIYMNKSSLTAYAYLTVLVIWGTASFAGGLMGGFAGAMLGGVFGGDSGAIESIILFWAFFGGLYKYFMDNVPVDGANFKTVLIGWMVASVAVSGAFTATGGQILVGLSGVAFALYVFGKRYYRSGSAFWNRPFQTTALVIMVALFIMCSKAGVINGMLAGSGVFGEMGGGQIVGLLISLAIIGGTGYYYFKNHWEKDDKLNIYLITIPVLSILAFLIGFGGQDASDASAILYTIAGAVCFWMWIKMGMDKKYPPILLLGLVAAIYLIQMKFTSLGDVGLIVQGLLVLAFGAGLLFLVKMIDDAFGLNALGNILPNKPGGPSAGGGNINTGGHGTTGGGNTGGDMPRGE